MSTPAPKAMMEAIMLFLRLTKDARIAPGNQRHAGHKPP